MTAPPREPTPEPCVNCGKARSDHYIVNFADGPQISGITWICPGSVYDAAPASSAGPREILAPLWSGDGPGATCAPSAEPPAQQRPTIPQWCNEPPAQAATDDLVRDLNDWVRTFAYDAPLRRCIERGADTIVALRVVVERQAREIAATNAECVKLRGWVNDAEQAAGKLQAERDALREVVKAADAMRLGLDCPMCDSGKLRNPAKEHWDTCAFANYDAAREKVKP